MKRLEDLDLDNLTVEYNPIIDNVDVVCETCGEAITTGRLTPTLREILDAAAELPHLEM